MGSLRSARYSLAILETGRKRALPTHSDDNTRTKKARDTGSPSNNHSFDTSDMDVDPQPAHRVRETMTEVNRYEKVNQHLSTDHLSYCIFPANLLQQVFLGIIVQILGVYCQVQQSVFVQFVFDNYTPTEPQLIKFTSKGETNPPFQLWLAQVAISSLGLRIFLSQVATSLRSMGIMYVNLG